MPIAALRSLMGLALERGAPLLAVAFLAGCISPQSYIDPALPAVRGQDIAPVASPKPVQLLYEFRTKGAPNARATEQTRPMVLDAINEAHMFGGVSSTPVAEGGVLTMVIDNVALTDDAVRKGFTTGLTLGLVGSMVTDGYVCTATYSLAGGASTSASVKHALHTTIGNADGPPGLSPMKPMEAIPIIIRQMTLNVLQVIRKGM